MRYETLEALKGAAEEQLSKHNLFSGASAMWRSVVDQVEAELDRRRRDISADPITITESEIKALGWRSYSPPDGVTGGRFIEYTDPSHWFVVRFWSNGKVEVYGLQSLESEEPSGVKTTEDLLLLLFLISGKNPRTA